MMLCFQCIKTTYKSNKGKVMCGAEAVTYLLDYKQKLLQMMHIENCKQKLWRMPLKKE